LSHLGVFVCAKRTAAADEAGGGSVAAGNPVAARWLGRVCEGLVSGNRLHSCGDRHQSAGAAQHRNLAYQLCRVDVSRFRSAALVSAGAVTSYVSHSTDLSPLSRAGVCVALFIKPILGNRYLRSRGFIVSEPGETHPRSEIADVPTPPCPPLDSLGCPDPHPSL